MNTTASGAEVMHQPMKKTGSPAKKRDVARVYSDKQILNALYKHYGRPENVVKEKVKMYTRYVSPAGNTSPDWIVDGWQQGRVTVFTGHREKEGDLFYKTKIGKEGVGTWFIATKENKLKVSIGGKVDIIQEMGE